MFENENQDKINQQNTENNELSSCEAELQEYKNRYLYLNAEFDNYRKRIEKEKKQWFEHGEDIVLKKILGVIDDFDRAFDQLEKQPISDDIKNHLLGFKLIEKSLNNILAQFNVEEIKAGEFNPEFHEALTEAQSNQHKSGEIVDIYEKGYIRNGRLLRPAKVSVAK